jgi:hypothetical protein
MMALSSACSRSSIWLRTMAKPRPYGITTPMKKSCEVHKHIRNVPTVKHHVWPKEFGGPTIKDNLADLCENGHYSVHNYLDKISKYGSPSQVPWHQKILYGKKTRELAALGWSRIQRHAM